jgi:hypothetical protein
MTLINIVWTDQHWPVAIAFQISAIGVISGDRSRRLLILWSADKVNQK